jgi:hypothetical protein
MSNVDIEGPGQYGIFGTAASSQLGKIRRANIKGNYEIGMGHPISELKGQRFVNPGQLKRDYQTVNEAKKYWYNPLKEDQLVNPIENIIKIDDPEGKGMFTQVGPGAEDLAVDAPGIRISERVDEAERLYEDAQTAKTDALADLNIEQKEARTTFDIGKREIAEQRKLVARGAEEEYLGADIAAGQTGMAMSAPAAQGYQMEGSVEAMRGLDTQSSELRRALKSDEGRIEGKREEVQKEFDEAEKTYFGDLATIYDEADAALDTVDFQLQELLGYHRLGRAGLKGVAGMFTESSTPGSILGQERIQQASDYAQEQRAIAQEGLANVGE